MPTDSKLNDLDVGGESQSVSFWDNEGKLAALLDEIAHELRLSRSELLETIVAEHLHEYADPAEISETKKRWLNLKKQEIEEGYAKELAKYQKQRGTFINFIASQIHDMVLRGADWEEVKNWISEQRPLFQNRGLTERYEHVYKNPQQYFKSYSEWVRQNHDGSGTAYQAPKIGESDDN